MAFDKMLNKKYVSRYVTFAILGVGLFLYLFIGAISTEWSTLKNIAAADYIVLIMTLGVLGVANYEIIKMYDGLKWQWWVQGITYLLTFVMFIMPLQPSAAALNFPFYSYIPRSSEFFREWVIAVVYIITFLIYLILTFANSDINFNKALYSFLLSFFLVIAFKSLTKLLLNGTDPDGSGVGWSTVLWVLIIVICSDSFAFVGGISFGKHKLAPTVSPNKTVEGAVIGTLCAVIFASLYAILMLHFGPEKNIVLNIYLNNFSYHYPIYILLALLLSMFSLLGDLFFSWIKRRHNIKDFSNILPGHGGVLDRLDSISFVFFVMYIVTSAFWF